MHFVNHEAMLPDGEAMLPARPRREDMESVIMIVPNFCIRNTLKLALTRACGCAMPVSATSVQYVQRNATV